MQKNWWLNCFSNIPCGENTDKVYKMKDTNNEKPSSQTLSAGTGRAKQSGFIIPFRMGSARKMVVNVTLTFNYKSIDRQFIIDTGANITVITYADAKALGIKDDHLSGSGVGLVAGGSHIIFHEVKLDKLQVADMIVNSPSVSILEGGHRLLGMDILGNYNIQVDNNRSLLILQ